MSHQAGYQSEKNDQATAPSAVAKEKPKAKPKTSASRKNREPSSERYDWSRAEYADPRDSRCQGFPCWGQHQPEKEGRGSLSGRNGHAKWEVCSVCRLRTLYVPTHGSKGTYRSAGPLPADAARAMEKVKDTVLTVPEDRETLTTKAVGISGAKESLLKKLAKLENEEKALQTKGSSPGNGLCYTASKDCHRGFQESGEARSGDHTGEVGGGDGGLGGGQEVRTGHLSPEAHAMLLQSGMDYIEDANAALDELYGQRVELMEICCPTDSRLTETFLKKGRSAIRIGLPAFDFKTKAGLTELKGMLRKIGRRWRGSLCHVGPTVLCRLCSTSPLLRQKPKVKSEKDSRGS